MTGKAELRAEAKRRLRAFLAGDRAAAEKEIDRLVWTVPEVAAARTLLLFADLPEEVTTDAIAAEAIGRGVRVVYPKTEHETRTMTLHHVTALAQLHTGRFGIREPDPELCPIVPVEEIDAALVPGLAWDRAGARLGRGAGYYDRLFGDARWRGFRCGIFYALQEMEHVPAEEWDVRLEAVVTEREVWRGEGS